jgi:hypothetical protein
VRLRLALVPAVAACLAGAAGITAHFSLRDAATTMSDETGPDMTGAAGMDMTGIAGMEADPPDQVAAAQPPTPYAPALLPSSEEAVARDLPQPLPQGTGAVATVAAQEEDAQGVAEQQEARPEAIHVAHAGTFLPGSGLDSEAGPDGEARTAGDEAENPLTRLVVSVGSGGTLSGVLGNAGVPSEQANGAIDALRSVFNPRKLKAGQEITVIFENGDDDRVFVGLEFEPDVDRAVAVARAGDA